MSEHASSPPHRSFISRVIAWLLARRLVRAFLLYSEHRGPLLANSVTYRTLFSVFAGVLLGFSLVGIWLSANSDAWKALIAAINRAVPGLIGTNGIIDPASISIESMSGFTVAGALGLVGLIGAAIGAVASLRIALRTIADEITDDVFFLWVMLRNLAMAIAIGVGLVASAAISFLGGTFVTSFLGWIGVGEDSAFAQIATRVLSIGTTFLLDAVIIVLAVMVLSGRRAGARALWSGALLGAVGLTVLQQLSGLFLGGADRNPLLTSFASLIALLLWLNLSAQVILLAGAYVFVGDDEARDRVAERYGAETFAQRRVRRAERTVMVATEELTVARKAEQEEREKLYATDDEDRDDRP